MFKLSTRSLWRRRERIQSGPKPGRLVASWRMLAVIVGVLTAVDALTLATSPAPAHVVRTQTATTIQAGPGIPPTSASRNSSTTGVPTTTGPLVNRRGLLQRDRSLGQGQLRFEAPTTERPRLSAGAALAIATRSVQAKVSGSTHEAFFALFSATSPAQPNPDGTSTPVFDRRPVWVVRFPTVKGRRQSGIVQRKNSPTTTSLEVLTEIVAIIDDRTGKFLLSSEYLAEAGASVG